METGIPSEWARLRAARASSSGVIVTLPLQIGDTYWGDTPRRCQDRAVDQKWYFGVASSDLSSPTGTMRPCGTRKGLPTGGVGVAEHCQLTAHRSVLGLGSRDNSVNAPTCS